MIIMVILSLFLLLSFLLWHCFERNMTDVLSSLYVKGKIFIILRYRNL